MAQHSNLLEIARNSRGATRDRGPTETHVRWTRWLPTAPAAAFGALGIYAMDAWVVQVVGETTIARRMAAAVGIAFALVGVAAASRLPYRIRALGMLLSGVVGLTVTAPIVGSHIAKLGVEGSAITGIAAVMAAVALVTLGSVRLIRSARTLPRKLLAVPIAFILLQFVVYPLGSAVYATQAAHPELGSRTPADVGLRYEAVTVRAFGGIPLEGWYVPSTNGSAVLLRHGSGSTRTATLDHAALLAQAGYGVLMTDARGHGDSGGRINELGWHGPQDITASIDYLEARSDVTGRIGVLGLSMGGEEALNAAADDDRIAAVVAEGVGVSDYNDSVANGAHPIARFVNWTQYSLTEVLSDAPQPDGIVTSIPKIAPRPVLLIVGDETVEQTMGPIYADAGGPTTELWTLPDTPHTDALIVRPSEYRARVLAIFEEGLLSSSE